MVRKAREMLSMALLGAVLAFSAVARAQAPPLDSSGPRSIMRFASTQSDSQNANDEEIPVPSSPSDMLTAEGDEEEFRGSLPRPPVQPQSLFDPAPPVAPPVDLEGRFFQPDRILDPPQWGRPGWFANVDVAVIKPHVSNDMLEQVTTGLGKHFVVQPGSAHLDWTAAPRIEIGYRLPSGLGEISLSDRYFQTQGTGLVAGLDGPATRTTHFLVNFSDLDYGSREYTPFANWSLRFRGGLRAAQTNFTSRVDQPFAQAAAGSTLLSQGASNRTTAFGFHFGVESQRRLARPGLSLVNSIDIADLFTREKQIFFATTTVPALGGGFDGGTVVDTPLQSVPVLTVQVGFNYRPPQMRNSSLYFGYYGQFWYQFATNSNFRIGPFGQSIPTEFDNEGVRLQYSWNY
jgi:hypothetical protein